MRSPLVNFISEISVADAGTAKSIFVIFPIAAIRFLLCNHYFNKLNQRRYNNSLSMNVPEWGLELKQHNCIWKEDFQRELQEALFIFTFTFQPNHLHNVWANLRSPHKNLKSHLHIWRLVTDCTAHLKEISCFIYKFQDLYTNSKHQYLWGFFFFKKKKLNPSFTTVKASQISGLLFQQF